MDTDRWLERWTALIGSQAAAPTILELGCGEGRDTQFLLQAGFEHVTAVDISERAVEQCSQLSSSLRCFRHDLRDPLPFAGASFDVVLASLSLHYFSWQTTEAVVEEIRRVLVPGGLLLCRVNSINDVHHGSVGHPELDHHSYQVNGNPKRFFDREDVDRAFGSGWTPVAAEELTISRYLNPKTVWEVVTRKELSTWDF